jgi:hypothetical protein
MDASSRISGALVCIFQEAFLPAESCIREDSCCRTPVKVRYMNGIIDKNS